MQHTRRGQTMGVARFAAMSCKVKLAVFFRIFASSARISGTPIFMFYLILFDASGRYLYK